MARAHKCQSQNPLPPFQAKVFARKNWGKNDLFSVVLCGTLCSLFQVHVFARKNMNLEC